MRKDSDRDESVARLLRQTLTGRATEPGSCVDGEVLAAWSAGALAGPQVATVEAHLARCARCQALLAAFARSAPANPDAPSFWQRRHLQWVLPVAAAATVFIVWTALPTEQTQTTPESLQARGDVPSAAIPSGTIGSIPTGTAPTAPAPAEAPQAPSPIPEQSAARLENELPGDRTEAASPDLDAAATDSAAVAAARPAEPPGRVNAEQERPAPESSPLALGGVADARRDGTAPPLGALAEEVDLTSPRAAAASAPAERREAPRQETAAPIEIRSPDAARRWRILPGGSVERSTTGGAVWEAAVIDPPAAVTAGSSPAPLVCWLVGPGGVVAITTDGGRFERVPFAEPLDLVGVRAIDARSAVVTAADGTDLQTTNRGGTWTRTTR